MKAKFPIEPGMKFGRWTVIGLSEERDNASRCWICQCSCKARTIMVVRSSSLRSGHSTSCGCFNKQRIVETHTKHGMVYTSAYQSYRGMITRCCYPTHSKYKYYGGKGIRVCQAWREAAANFFASMGEKPEGASLDRIDNQGHYSCGKCPECKKNGWPFNCRWATRAEQVANTSWVITITYNGQTQTLAEWARMLGIPQQRLWLRYTKGWQPPELFDRRRYNRARKPSRFKT